MNTYTTTVERTMHGNLQAKTIIDLGDGRRELHVTTDKAYRGGISCDARVMQRTGSGFLSHAFGLSRDGSGDYSKTLAEDRAKRATQKALETMHREALATIDSVIAEANAWYAAQEARKSEEHARRCIRVEGPNGTIRHEVG